MTMPLYEYASLVLAMRKRQQDYFRTKSGVALEDCKTLERKVDRATEDILRPPTLFGEGDCPPLDS